MPRDQCHLVPTAATLECLKDNDRLLSGGDGCSFSLPVKPTGDASLLIQTKQLVVEILFPPLDCLSVNSALWGAAAFPFFAAATGTRVVATDLRLILRAR